MATSVKRITVHKPQIRKLLQDSQARQIGTWYPLPDRHSTLTDRYELDVFFECQVIAQSFSRI